MTNLPKMTVENNEKRKDTAHGLRAPHKPGCPEFLQGLQDMLSLVELAKIDSDYVRPRVGSIINTYSPVLIDVDDLGDIMMKFGFKSRFQATQFVKDDECVEFMVRVAHYCKRRKCPVRKDRDFIDGEGVGLYARRADRTDRTLEKIFDAKYHFKQIRPLEYLNNTLGMDCTDTMNYIHPGHYAYPAGHGGKFYETVDIARDTRELTDVQDHEILVASIVLSMGRSGGGVHYPEDNLASGYFAGLPEFSIYKA